MANAIRRVASLSCAVALAFGGLAPCAGWQPTPEARLACCEEAGGCPMHANQQDDATRVRVTQVEADGCCASSEQDESTPSPRPYAATVIVAVLATPVAFLVPGVAVSRDAWRALTPAPASPVPKHLLLSVFLV